MSADWAGVALEQNARTAGARGPGMRSVAAIAKASDPEDQVTQHNDRRRIPRVRRAHPARQAPHHKTQRKARDEHCEQVEVIDWCDFASGHNAR